MKTIKDNDAPTVSEPALFSIESIEEGQSFIQTVAIKEEIVKAFIELTNDRAPVHVDAVHARRLGFDKTIVHGFLVASFYSRILGMFLPGGNTVIHQVRIDMTAPVIVGDVLTYKVTVQRIIEGVKSVQLNLETKNQDGQVVSRGSAVCVFRA